MRVLSYLSGSRPWTFGCMLGAYLLGIALASRECEKLGERSPEPGPKHRAVLAFSVVGAGVAAFAVVPLLAALAPLRAWPAGLVLITVAAGALGAALPLTAHLAIPPDARAGSRLSYVYLADILGATAGGVVTGYLLLDWMPLGAANVLVGVSTVLLGGALIAGAGLSPRARAAALGATAVAGVACVGLGPLLHDRLWERLKMLDAAGGKERFAEVVENRHGIIAVTRAGVVMGGGVYDGAFSTDVVHDRNGIVRAYVLAGIHAAPRRVLLVGLGSGSWAQVLANLPGVESLTVAEINPGYLGVVGRHAEVASVLSNPRVEIVIDDARRWLLRHPERKFDAIISNGSFHWREHATNLLSVEFARLVRSRLAPGGVYGFNTTGSRDASDTALAVFANGLAVGTFFVAGDAPLAFDPRRHAAAVASMRIDGKPVLDLSTPSGRAWFELASRAAIRLEERRADARVITDDNMRTEWSDGPFSF